VNPYLNTVARFLNMHARAGVGRDRMHVAVVVHGEAAKDVLEGGLFRERYGADNQNAGLLAQLAAAGVELYLCGQSAMSRDLPRDRLLPDVRLALSAMTAMAVLKGRGYATVN
jgi:intracellular sulfur oxidation DsrE/DsrF family protein